MSHSFKISVKNGLPEALKKVEGAIVDQGGEFKGDTSSGGFSGKTVLGKVHGEYSCTADDNDEIEITITKKPMVAPYSKIESAIREYFA